MKSSSHEKPSFGFKPTQRKVVSVSPEALIKTGPLLPNRPIPLVIQPAVEGLNLVEWTTNNQPVVEELLMKHRALLFRDFSIHSVDEFNRFVQAASRGELLEYVDRSSPRHEVGRKVYTATDHPADQAIFLHNEGTYKLDWPLKIYFCCLIKPDKGGETPIADGRRIFARISPAIKERFAQKKVLYVRNYGDGFGLPWQEVFQTADKAAVEAYCRQNLIDFEWKAGNRLRTRQVRPAIARHPLTGEEFWFNHATFFHVTTLTPDLRDALLKQFAEEELPYNTYYGDGSPIEQDVLEELRAIYRDEKIVYPWQVGDILMLDNMSILHGREPYEGERKVIVAMMEPHSGYGKV